MAELFRAIALEAAWQRYRVTDPSIAKLDTLGEMAIRTLFVMRGFNIAMENR